MNRNIFVAVFLAGALAVLWVGLGFVGSNWLALAVTLLIAAVYGLGALEIRHFRQATATLSTALADIPADLTDLGGWLDRLHPSLQNPVRLRIEGERIGLPGPALTPYLVGLLVMLGMLGTFLGMVATFNGAAFALDGTADLQAIRASLTAPIKGLGLAFGTSVAGVATSAMLGLLSALGRRERQQAAQLLDSKIATVLRGFSLAQQRQETYQALRFQAQALPEVVDKLQALMLLMERQSQQLNERLVGNQESFHRDIKGVYDELASSVDRSLKASLADSVRAAGDSIKPVAEAALTGIAREATALQQRLVDTTQTQLDGLTARIDASAGRVAEAWTAAVAKQESGGERLIAGLEHALTGIAKETTQLQQGLIDRTQTQLDALTVRIDASANGVAAAWTAAIAKQEAASDRLLGDMAQSLQTLNSGFEQRSAALLAAIGEAHGSLQAAQASGDQQRMAAWTQSLADMAATLHGEWQQAGAQTLAQQQQICTTLAQTADRITHQAQANADQTLSEITRLLHTAAEAPRAAAEVIGQLRQELSSSIARDNELLEERSRIMATLDTLLATINHAAAEQRATIDALVASAEGVLNRVGGQFAAQVDSEAERMAGVAAHVSSGAVEVASLGESFGLAVQLFTESNEKLMANLQRIEAAMDKSLARSDEQLAYYVAQAREIIDLSIMSQKEVVDDMRQLSAKEVG